jgi:predicted nucleic acid-binding protein
VKPPRFVVDNSIVMAWCFADEESPLADSVMDALASGEAIAPPIWPLEVCNVLLVAERQRRLSKRDSARFLELIRKLPIHVEQETSPRTFNDVLPLAREHGLSAYDASYLDLAMRSGLPLATQDRSLIRAARKCGVPMFAEKLRK